MRIHANAKINLALNITGQREDGYHLLDMVMQSVSVCDTLTLTPAEGVSLTVDGVPAGHENLVLKAAEALLPYAPGAGAAIALTKRIPAMAGMGGGSADAAAALRGLMKLWGLADRISETELLGIGLRLGADVPFCLVGGCARVTGIGENVMPVPPVWKDETAVIVHPGVGVSTPQAFRMYDREKDGCPADIDRMLSSGSGWTRFMGNVLEKAAVKLCPAVSAVREDILAAGADAVLMTGSGSAVFGIWSAPQKARSAARTLRERWPFVREIAPRPAGWEEAEDADD